MLTFKSSSRQKFKGQKSRNEDREEKRFRPSVSVEKVGQIEIQEEREKSLVRRPKAIWDSTIVHGSSWTMIHLKVENTQAAKILFLTI